RAGHDRHQPLRRGAGRPGRPPPGGYLELAGGQIRSRDRRKPSERAPIVTSRTKPVTSTPMHAPRSISPAKLDSSIRIEMGREFGLYSSTVVLMSRIADRKDSRPTVMAVGASSGSRTRR